MGNERDEYPSKSAERPGGWWKPGRRRRRMDPGASGPNADHDGSAGRLRRRAPAISGSADRRSKRRPVGHECGIAE